MYYHNQSVKIGGFIRTVLQHDCKVLFQFTMRKPPGLHL